ncbi:hypothetical protein CRYUN_Cryun38cG0013100 [Craigia yunnanensis]
MEVPVQDLDQDQINQIDVTKLSEKRYHRPATSSEEPHQAIQEGSMTKASIVSNAALEKSERKRKIDKAYRERCKMKKQKMTQNIVTLREENEHLKIEHESLKQNNACMTQMLQSQRGELNEYKSRLCNLKLKNEKQKAIVQILSDLVVDRDFCHENQKFKNEDDQSREIVKLSHKPLKLVEENGKLQHDNLVLKVKIDALCGKIVDENSKNCGLK